MSVETINQTQGDARLALFLLGEEALEAVVYYDF